MSKLFSNNKEEKDIIQELYTAPVKDYFVTFKYHRADNPKEILKLEFTQIDYELVDCFTQGPRYTTDIENEFKIH